MNRIDKKTLCNKGHLGVCNNKCLIFDECESRKTLDHSNTKKAIRRATLRHFKKTGVCQRCGFEGETTWHHNKYIMVSKGLSKKRGDIIEVCRRCHNIMEKEK